MTFTLALAHPATERLEGRVDCPWPAWVKGGEGNDVARGKAEKMVGVKDHFH
jgi:hypothetical protein